MTVKISADHGNQFEIDNGNVRNGPFFLDTGDTRTTNEISAILISEERDDADAQLDLGEMRRPVGRDRSGCDLRHSDLAAIVASSSSVRRPKADGHPIAAPS